MQMAGVAAPLQTERYLPPPPPQQGDDRGGLVPLVFEAVDPGGQVLVFCRTPRACRTTAAFIAQRLFVMLPPPDAVHAPGDCPAIVRLEHMLL